MQKTLLRATIYALRATRYELRTTCYALRATRYELWTTCYELRITYYALRLMVVVFRTNKYSKKRNYFLTVLKEIWSRQHFTWNYLLCLGEKLGFFVIVVTCNWLKIETTFQALFIYYHKCITSTHCH